MKLSTFIQQISMEIERIGDINIHQVNLIAKHLDFHGDVSYPTSVRLDENEDETFDIVLFRQGGSVVDSIVPTNKEKVEYLEAAIMLIAKDFFGNFKQGYTEDELNAYIEYAVGKSRKAINKRRKDETVRYDRPT